MSKNKKAKALERQVNHKVNSGVDNAKHWAAPKIESALAWAEAAAAEGRHRAQHLGDRASNGVQGAVDRATPAVENARDRVQHQYLPAASGRLAGAAGQASKSLHNMKIPSAVDDALARVTGDKKAGKKLRKAAEQYSKTAEKQLKKHSRKQSKSSGKPWLVVGAVAAVGAAAAAVWQLTKPVEDPWKTPAPQPMPKQPQQSAAQGADPDINPAPAGPAAAAQTGQDTGPVGRHAAPTPGTAAGGNAVVDSADERVEGAPAPRSAP